MIDQAIARWARCHGIPVDERGRIENQGHTLAYHSHNDEWQFGPNDGGVLGEVVRFDAGTDALMVRGTQTAWVGEEEEAKRMTERGIGTHLHDGYVEWTGIFACWPHDYRVEVDGPYDEDTLE